MYTHTHTHTHIDGQEALGLLWSLSAIPGTLDQYTNETLVDMVRIGRTSAARDGWRQTAALSALHNLLCYSGFFFSCFYFYFYFCYFFSQTCCATQATARFLRPARWTWRSRRSMSTPAPPLAPRRRRRFCSTSAASMRARSSPPSRPSGRNSEKSEPISS
jgi:hypothetical protein